MPYESPDGVQNPDINEKIIPMNASLNKTRIARIKNKKKLENTTDRNETQTEKKQRRANVAPRRLTDQTNRNVNKQINQKANKPTNERTNERRNERAHEQKNERRNERTKKQMEKRFKEWLKERTNEQTNEHTNEKTKERRNEGRGKRGATPHTNRNIFGKPTRAGMRGASGWGTRQRVGWWQVGPTQTNFSEHKRKSRMS